MAEIVEPAEKRVDLTDLDSLMAGAHRLRVRLGLALGGALLGLGSLALATGILSGDTPLIVLSAIICTMIGLSIGLGIRLPGTRIVDLRLGSVSMSIDLANGRSIQLDYSASSFMATIVDFSDDPNSTSAERHLDWLRWSGDRNGVRITKEITAQIVAQCRRLDRPISVRRVRTGHKTFHWVTITRIGGSEESLGTTESDLS